MGGPQGPEGFIGKMRESWGWSSLGLLLGLFGEIPYTLDIPKP